MIEQTTINNRPALVLYLNDALEPVDQDKATLLKVDFQDDGSTGFFSRKVEDLNPTKAVPTSKSKPLPAHELFKVRVWLGLQGIKG